MRIRALLAGAAALLVASCDLEPWLDWRDIASFREVSAAEGRQIAREPGARLVFVRGAWGRAGGVPEAQLLDADEALPSTLTAAEAPVVILAEESGAALRMAARLARAGIQGVVVVRGGLAAWELEAARAGAPSGELGG